MDVLRKLLFALLVFNLSSCAKLGYLSEQGMGQLDLIWSARDNEEVLNDPNVSKEVKNKVRLIGKYKSYFYEYWQREPTEIYDQTTILDSRAVTYLVIASKPNEIKPKKECFPFYGCFPYLGFFKEESAREYASELRDKGFETYTRDVLAYSTLGNLDDPILSSFFLYNKYSLTETIFHELFHTIFFAKNEVDLNENLANYFGKEMLREYYKDDEGLEDYFAQLEKSRELKKVITKHVREVKELLKKENWKELKESYIKDTMQKSLKQECLRLKLTNCWPTRMKWNSASMAAFMTYEKSQNHIEDYAKSHKGNLRALLKSIEAKYEKYQEEGIDSSFESYLFNIKE